VGATSVGIEYFTKYCHGGTDFVQTRREMKAEGALRTFQRSVDSRDGDEACSAAW